MSENPSQTQISRLAEFCPNNAITTDQIFPQMSRYPRNSSEDGSANVAVYRQLAADCDFDISSRERESEKEITEGCLQINYVFLKNEMESCDLLDHLHSIDLFSEEFLETCRETPRRRRRNDLIIKEIFKIAKNTSKEILQHFVEALCMTGQEHIVNYLLAHKYPPKLENQIPTVPMDFLISMSHRIIEDVEPREIIDNLLETEAISFLDHEDVEQIQYRRDRVKFILQMADQSRESSAEIIRAIKATYSKLFEEYERRAEKNAINQQVSVSIRMNLQSLDETESVQEGLRQIEINAVNNFDSRNPRNNQFINDLEKCICKLDRLEISSIVIHVRAENRESLQKILNKIKSGRAIDWLYPMLNETDKQSLTRMRANKLLVTVRVDEEGNTVHLQPPEGCLCQLNKDTIIKNKDTLLKTLTSTDIEVLARRMKSHGLNGPILTKGEPTFLDFLIDENNPQISFCIFEEYLKSQKPLLLHSLLTDCEPQDTVVLNPNIKEHENFLAEELEVHPYLPVIQTWKNKKSTNFLKTIEECQCRSSRVEAFLNFIICEKDPTWFWEEVRKKQKYIWDYILSSRKNDAQLKRDLLAAKLISDEIVKEIDPLCLKSNMKTCTIEQLGFVDIEKIQCRKLQAEFLMNRLTMETIDEFMDALSKSGYNRIRNQIKAGSLAEKYICPRIHDKKNIYESEFDISPEHFEIFQVPGMASSEEQQLSQGFRGYAVLISNEEFPFINPAESTSEDPTRKGADKDDTNLQYIFNTKLGFQLLDKRTYKNVSKEPLKSNVSKEHWIHKSHPQNERRSENEKCPCPGHDSLPQNERCPCQCISCRIQTTDHSNSEGFVLAISTHGVQVDRKQEKTFSDDYGDERVKLSDIIETLNDKNCKTLKGKPRIILLQDCRSDPDVPEDKQIFVYHYTRHNVLVGRSVKNLIINHGDVSETVAINNRTGEPQEITDTDVERIETNDPEKDNVYSTEEALRNLPSEFLIIFSTVSGKKTWHNFEHGSWLIQELREVVENIKTPDMNFLTVLTKIAENVALEKESKEGYKCAVCIVNRLLRPLIFRGIRDTSQEQPSLAANIPAL